MVVKMFFDGDLIEMILLVALVLKLVIALQKMMKNEEVEAVTDRRFVGVTIGLEIMGVFVVGAVVVMVVVCLV